MKGALLTGALPALRRSLLLAALWLLALGTAASAQALTDLPTARGLPLTVQVGVAFVDVSAFSENTGLFTATVDVRLRWQDSRLASPPAEAGAPPRIWRDAEADARLAEIWSPGVALTNLKDEPTYQARGLRIFADGTVELMSRTSGDFSTPVDVGRFPFDHQQLEISLATRQSTTHAVVLAYDQDDLDFSQAAATVSLDGWETGFVTLASKPLSGWYNASHARVVAGLEVQRRVGLAVAAIFIPLLASLLIPMLALWLNRIDDGVFQIETFELVNLIVGGLFAVIALNFTIYSSYTALASSNNSVNQLFALNYATLGISLLVNILFYRFQVFERLFGRLVQAEIYRFLMWAIPVIVFTLALSFIFTALA
ncbi:hypothetical protein GCM10007301_01050 [Azorhizobium oxalatiphilum]|uniref:Neurotransmitter-gated ion-channel ligand-binding domain-containing protein n=1 Tax=Azorhizobium oxalatiphilum TaxID=980631 RepID=A0A917BH46_9HYPH|nr:hypothetical protein [Azorhizobium oxalatiphilum]GGF45310.1 hypothetical protein GCM10007301_01050 [Azorhizobium oxalatiphilum]